MTNAFDPQSEKPRSVITGKVIAGGILLLLGALFTLDNFDVLDAGRLFDYWPMILVGVGLAKIVKPKGDGDRVLGIGLLVFGVLLQANALDLFPFSFRELWPVVLIAIGLGLLWQARFRRRVPQGAPGGASVPTGSKLDEFAIMGGGERVVSVPDFQGGEVVAIMGGFEIDLRGASMAGDRAVIEVFALWGGIDIKVPQDWNVSVQGAPILGVMTNSARPTGDSATPRKLLVIDGVAIMGGVEVKN